MTAAEDSIRTGTPTGTTGNNNSASSELLVVVVGVDVGAESTKVVLGQDYSCEIVRNDVGGHTTPTVIAFGETDKQPRQLGTKVSKNGVYHLNRLLYGEIVNNDDDDDDNNNNNNNNDDDGGGDLLKRFYPFTISSSSSSSSEEEENGGTTMIGNVLQHGESQSFSNSALLGMLFGKVKESVSTTWLRQQTINTTASAIMPPLSMAVACPPDMSAAAQQQVVDAAYAAGIDTVQLVDRSVAYQTSYIRKFPEHADKYVMIVDVGHADASVSILGPSSLPKEEEKEEEEEEEEKEQKETEEPTIMMKVLACERHRGLGAGVVDVRLWQHFQSTHPALASVTPKSRGGQRLLAGMTKLKHLLSQLPEGNVTVENVGQDDADVSLEAKRSLLVELCAEEVQALTTLVQQALVKSGIESSSQLYSVEVVGGGCRMPWVKEVLEKATQMSTLSYTLDDTSAALGAVLIGEEALTNKNNNADTTTVGIMARRSSDEAPTERQLALRVAEEKMAALDQQLHLRSATLNQIESHILGLRSAKHENHGNLLPAELFTYLDEVEEWLFSPEADDAGYEALQAKWQEIQTKTSEFSVEYTAAMESERKTKEAEMEAEAKQAQKEREGEEGAGDEEDHDNRRLPKKRRMEIIMKNKNEGGELFSDGNFKFAAARYAKALSHCAKFVDLGPDDLKEVNGVKVTLNLNLALAYLKMQNPDQALRYSNDALALDEDNTKALYRRASVYYEKKSWDAASKDLKKALKTTPDDKALQKLLEKVDAQMKRQKLKEKKMAQKMFG